MLNFKSILVAAAICCGTATTAFGADETITREVFMRTGVRAPQPVGHYHFCKVNPAECSKTRSNGTRRPLTEIAWHVILEVNTNINGKIIQVTDQDYYGKTELWTYPRSAGDCEDIALLKKRELKARGFAESDLLITVVKKGDGSGHAILTVRTSEGDFVLDNVDPRVRRWWQTSYRFEKRQSSSNAGQWVEIEQPAREIPVAAIKN
jgi:predicted transglutaminase-like cysteine proteinase